MDSKPTYEELEQRIRELRHKTKKYQQIETALKRGRRALNARSKCIHAVEHAENEQQLLHEICRIILDVGGYLLSWVGYAEQDEASDDQHVLSDRLA